MPMIRVLVPEVGLPDGLDLGNALTTPREWVANPKAVAAQPFAKPDIHAAYHASGRWQDIASMFTVQYAAKAPPEIALELGEGVHFPWAVKPDATSGCLVWVADVTEGPYVRHIRIYGTHDEALRDNAALHMALI